MVVVRSVDPNGTASDSGLEAGDILVEIQRVAVSDTKQALTAFKEQASANRGFAAVLVEHETKRTWLPVALSAKQ